MARNEASMVRVTNVGSRTFRAQYANAWYTIDPGEDAFLPYYATVLWFGNPNAANVGDDRDDQHRHHEVERLNVQYGVQNNPWQVPAGEDPDTFTTSDPENPQLYIDGYHPNLPRCAVFDLTTNEQLPMVLDDPEGEAVSAPRATLRDQRSMEAEIARMAEQQKIMIDLLAQSNPEAARRLAPKADDPMALAPTGAAVVDEVSEDPQPVDEAATEDTPPGRAPHAKAGNR